MWDYGNNWLENNDGEGMKMWTGGKLEHKFYCAFYYQYHLKAHQKKN